MLVLLQISQFRSFGESEFSALCLPQSALLVGLKIIHEKNLRVSLCCQELFHKILSEFLRPLRDVGTERVSPVLSSLQHVNLTQVLDDAEFLVLGVDEIDPSQFSCVIKMEPFHWTTFASPSA